MSEFEKQEAQRAHDRIRAQEDLKDQAAIKSGDAAIKTVILANGGAVVAVLAFLGNIAGKEKITVSHIADAAHSTIWFAAGLIAGLVCMLTAYLTNLNHGGFCGSHELLYTHPYVAPGRNTRFYSLWGRFWHWIAILAGIVSLAFFACGIWMVRETLLKLGAVG